MYVLMITPNKFPEGDAGAVRDNCFAKIYQSLGYDIFHIGMNVESASGLYQGISYVSLYEPNDGVIKKIKNNLAYKYKINMIFQKLKKENGIPSLIHIYDIPESGIKWAKKKAHEYGVPLIHDSVEWYSPCEFEKGRFAYPYILKDRTNRKLITKPIAVIAISTYLEKYFCSKGLLVTRIPVIMDSHRYRLSERSWGNTIRIVYAGSPAKKDYLAEAIQAFMILPNSIRNKFEFNILGADEEFVKSCCDGIIPSQILAYGRVPREKVIEVLTQSDFSILLRPENERYTKAGFPTKSVEAMMNGCAMLCNLTSDLEMYLVDKENSIVVKGCTVEAMEDAFMCIAQMPIEKIVQMKKKARNTAEIYFDYRHYIEIMRKFLLDARM